MVPAGVATRLHGRPSQRTVNGLPEGVLPAAQTPAAKAAATPSSCPPTLNDPAGPATSLPGRAAGATQGDVTAGIPAAPGPAGAPVPAEPQETTAHAVAANTTPAIGTRTGTIPRRPCEAPIPLSFTAPCPPLTAITHHQPRHSRRPAPCPRKQTIRYVSTEPEYWIWLWHK